MKNQMKKYFLIILSCLLLSCSPGGIYIRIQNKTQSDMENVIIKSEGKIQNIKLLKKDDLSEYYKVEKAYRYTWIEWESDGQKRGIYPKDYVGEKELNNGYYTYVITPFENQQQYYNIELQRDKNITRH